MDGLVIRPCLPFHEEARTAGPLCSTGVTPLPHSYGPFRLPLAFGRLPGFVVRPTLVRRFRGGARRVSPVDFTRPCRRAAAATPPEGSVVTRGGRNLLPSPSARGLGLRICFCRGHFCVHSRCGPATRLPPPKRLCRWASAHSVSFLAAIQATGLLVLAPVGLSPTERASLLVVQADEAWSTSELRSLSPVF